MRRVNYTTIHKPYHHLIEIGILFLKDPRVLNFIFDILN